MRVPHPPVSKVTPGKPSPPTPKVASRGGSLEADRVTESQPAVPARSDAQLIGEFGIL